MGLKGLLRHQPLVRIDERHPSVFMGREWLTFRLHDTPLHIVRPLWPELKVECAFVSSYVDTH